MNILLVQLLGLVGCGALWAGLPTQRLGSISARSCVACCADAPPLSASDQERLLLSETGLEAFIVAEMRSFLEGAAAEVKSGERSPWVMSNMEKLAAGFIDGDGNSTSGATEPVPSVKEAVDLLCKTASDSFKSGFNEAGLLSQLGSSISYFRNDFREAKHIAACERVGLSDYTVAHHITDMYHHRVFRGTYTKTLAPSGTGEVAARAAVGLPPIETDHAAAGEAEAADECLIWAPSGACLQTVAEEAAWRKRRFEKVQMEGTRDPRRGGSGTTR